MTASSEKVQAPWSAAQVNALNQYQRFPDGVWPLYTDDRGGPLIATSSGWVDILGLAQQDWAYTDSIEIGFEAMEIEALAERLKSIKIAPLGGLTAHVLAKAWVADLKRIREG